MRIEHVMDLIGNTPVVRLQHLAPKEGAGIYLKLEKYNLGGSIKDRAVMGMLKRAEERGEITARSTLVEPTSGNTGIALALAGNLLGIRVVIVMPETMSRERQDIIRSYGASLILTPGSLGMKGAIEKAESLVQEDEDAQMLNQFENPGNAMAHEETTAKEILRDVPEINALVAGIGTGGTITGVGRALKRLRPDIQIIGVEPATSAVLSGQPAGAHKIQGIGAGFIPELLQRDLIDRIMQVEDEDAMNMTRALALQEGLFLGISSGAAAHAAIRLAKEMPKEKTIVAIAPDGGEKYLSTRVFGGDKNA